MVDLNEMAEIVRSRSGPDAGFTAGDVERLLARKAASKMVYDAVSAVLFVASLVVILAVVVGLI